MLVKAGIGAAVLIAAAVLLSRVDFREIYNGMYPMNGLKRDALGLCHQASPTFIRALRSDQVSCYDSMPESIEQAIGWVRSGRPDAMTARTAIDVAERLLAEMAARGKQAASGPPGFTGYIAMPVAVRPCAATALAPLGASRDDVLAMSSKRLARRIARGDDTVLAALGLPAPGAPAGSRHERGLPVLSLSGDENPGAAAGLDAASGSPRAIGTGCRTPA